MTELFATIAVLGACATVGVALASRMRHAALDRACRAAFATAFSQARVPTFKLQYSYSVPVFRIGFESEAEYAQAKASGCTASFVAAVQRLCESRFGSHGRPYDASRAVEFFWPSADGQVKFAGSTNQVRGNEA